MGQYNLRPHNIRIYQRSKNKVHSRLSPERDNVRSSVFNRVQQAIVAKEIETLLDKGVIKPSCHESGEFVSPIFLRPKPDGTYRMILNLRAFNEFVQYHHFKMDTVETAINMMTPGCFMASIDLKNAYYTMAISTDHQKYLKFIFNSSLYQYTCLPNGLSCAPRVFTKLLKPVYSTLHNLGYLSLGDINDSYLQGDTSSECLQNVNCTASLFKKLGFYLHPTKSIVIPTQQLIFFGFVLNSIAMTVTPSKAGYSLPILAK